MNKQYFFLAITLLVSFALVFESCKKDEENKASALDYQDGTKLAEHIIAFKKSLSQKSGENLTLESAIKDMELLINAEHGFPFKEYATIKHFKETINIETDANEMVSHSALNNAYNELIEKVGNIYANCSFPEKGLIFVGLNKSKTEDAADVTVSIGYPGPPELDTFENCWYYGEDKGMCNGDFALIMDGGDTIAKKLAIVNPILDYYDCPGPLNEWRLVLEPQPLITLNGNEYQNAQGENLIFFLPDADNNGSFTDEEMQLSAIEMNYYYTNEYNVVYGIVPNEHNYLFPDYVLVSCEINGNNSDDNKNDLLTLHHENKLNYARRYWVSTGVIDNPTPIK